MVQPGFRNRGESILTFSGQKSWEQKTPQHVMPQFFQLHSFILVLPTLLHKLLKSHDWSQSEQEGGQAPMVMPLDVVSKSLLNDRSEGPRKKNEKYSSLWNVNHNVSTSRHNNLDFNLLTYLLGREFNYGARNHYRYVCLFNSSGVATTFTWNILVHRSLLIHS